MAAHMDIRLAIITLDAPSVWNSLYTYIYNSLKPNVGKYSSPMEHRGKDFHPPRWMIARPSMASIFTNL